MPACGAGEIVAVIAEKAGTRLKANPVRLCLPDSRCPMSHVLEEQYYLAEESKLPPAVFLPYPE
jgi:pyruvate/2-oxoglutarate/acetoin dehydrogenase E1 component